MENKIKKVQVKFPSGNEYKGEWENDKPNGFGIMTFDNQDLYEGGWKDGLMHGKGKYSFYDEKHDSYSSYYEGDFVQGKYEGLGHMVFADHSSYIGQWQAGVRCGEGLATFTTGNVFHGLWQQDKMLRGVYSLKSGDKYDGEIVEGKFNGYGKYYWSDGKWFEGTWKEGKMQNGIVFSQDGTFVEVENEKNL